MQLLLSCLLWPIGGAVQAEDSAADRLLHHFLLARPAPAISATSNLVRMQRVQELYVEQLAAHLGPAVGYKAGLTSVVVQSRFGVQQPILGVLHRDMLLQSPARMSADLTVRPHGEADLLVRIADDAINIAVNHSQALACLDAVFPFLELPDLLFDTSVHIDLGALVASNVGARYGVMGKEIPLRPGLDWQQRLADFEVQLLDADGKKLAQGEGKSLLGHPLQAVLWIRDVLQERGKQLRRGDLLSLGSLTPLQSVHSNTKLRARYTGLDPDGPVDVIVHID